MKKKMKIMKMNQEVMDVVLVGVVKKKKRKKNMKQL